MTSTKDAHLEAVGAYDAAAAVAARSEHGTSNATLDREHRAVMDTWEAWLCDDEDAAIAWNEAQDAPRVKTTPTNVPIARCLTCGLSHPVTRKHCLDCGAPSLFSHTTHSPNPAAQPTTSHTA